MITRLMPNGQLLCINQTTHALMAADFCRHWGNADFAKPSPYSVVMCAIAQHDNGWYEWEAAPELDVAGAPLAFIPGPSYAEKLPIWQRGIDRAAAQHPYMGLLVSRHAMLLYSGDLARLAGDELRATEAFVAKQEQWANKVRLALAGDAELHHAASETVLMSHTRLLQFGDSCSLQVVMPWSSERLFPHSPVDFAGSYTPITLRWAAQEMTFDPWPFGVDHFTVTVQGSLLDQQTFPSNAAYRAALAAAPLHSLTWHVAPQNSGA
jgi:hypothetical protein